LEARGYRRRKVAERAFRETTGSPARLILSADRPSIAADGRDIALITISAVDQHGRFVPTAANLIQFEVSGAARLIGVGHGDPSSHESHKASFRRLFNGLALAILQSNDYPGNIKFAAQSSGLAASSLVIRTNRPSKPPRNFPPNAL